MSLVRIGSINSLNLSNFWFYDLKLIEFEMHGIRFNIFEPVNLGGCIFFCQSFILYKINENKRTVFSFILKEKAFILSVWKICTFFYLPFIFKSNLYFLLSIFYVSDEYVLSFIYLLYFCLICIFFYLPFISESTAPIVQLLNYCVTVNLVPSIIYLMHLIEPDQQTVNIWKLMKSMFKFTLILLLILFLKTMKF